MTVYDFTVEKPKGEQVSLKDYEGKVLLIVNSATKCGFTPQYKELQKIYETHKDKGFEILEFPCNQFKEQAPENDEQIGAFCTGRFGITFPRFKKIDVNGENAIPLYKFLAEEKKFEGFGKGNPLALVLDKILKAENPNYKDEIGIKWNFTKFLIDRNGNVVARFEPTMKVSKVEKEIVKLLEKYYDKID